MMLEAKLWDTVRRHMGAAWMADKIDDHRAPNVADVFFTMPKGGHGWIELKCTDRPRDDLSVMRLPTLTDGQRSWLTSRGRSGVATWILTHVEQPNATSPDASWTLLHAWPALPFLGNSAWNQTIAVATCVWPGLPAWVRLAHILSAGKPL